MLFDCQQIVHIHTATSDMSSDQGSWRKCCQANASCLHVASYVFNTLHLQIVKLFYTVYHSKEAWLHLPKLVFTWRLILWWRQKQACCMLIVVPCHCTVPPSGLHSGCLVALSCTFQIRTSCWGLTVLHPLHKLR